MIFLLFGKERFLKDQAIEDLKKSYPIDASASEMDYRVFYPSKDVIQELVGFVTTAPFLSPHRMAILWQIDELSDSATQSVIDVLAKVPKSTIFILESEETNVQRSSVLSAIAEKAKTIACHTPFERDLPGWIEKQAKLKSLALGSGVSQYLATHYDNELAKLNQLLEQLALWVYPKNQIELDKVKAFIHETSQEDVFKLADYLFDGNKKAALLALDRLYEQGAKAPEIIAVLAGQIDRYRKALTAKNFGKTNPEIGEELKIPRMFQQNFFNRLSRLDTKKLALYTKELMDCDYSFKTGHAAERVAVEKFILTL